MIHKLSDILTKLSNSKFKKGFIKYLNSLNFNEFNLLFVSYMKIIARYEKIYIKKDVKRSNKNWFINRKIHKKYNLLFSVFNSKSDFIDKIISDMSKTSKMKTDILKDFDDTKKTIENLSKHVLTFAENPSTEDVIKINVMMIDSIYLNNKLQKLSSEIENFKTI